MQLMLQILHLLLGFLQDSLSSLELLLFLFDLLVDHILHVLSHLLHRIGSAICMVLQPLQLNVLPLALVPLPLIQLVDLRQLLLGALQFGLHLLLMLAECLVHLLLACDARLDLLDLLLLVLDLVNELVVLLLQLIFHVHFELVDQDLLLVDL